jgi:hypothetical protein
MNLTDTAPDELERDAPSIDERRALIDRIAGSNHFRRSARLRDFLLYVGGQSLIEGCPEIHEQEIGAKVFGRNAAYDRSQDNIVRVNATELRKRIEVYFATEGGDEALLLDIPRGGYKPVFRWRATEVVREGQSAEPAADLRPDTLGNAESRTPAIDTTTLPSRRIPWLLGIACALLAAGCAILLQQNRSLRKSLDVWDGKPAIASFWADFLRFHQQTDLVLPDDSVSVIEDITHRPVSLSDYLNHNYMREIQSSDSSLERKLDLDQLFGHNLVTFGGVRAAQQILPMLPAESPHDLTMARYYAGDSVKHNNIILIGGKKANPWVHLFDDRANFITDYDDVRQQAFIRNVHPNPGEPAIYTVPTGSSALVGYSVIAYLPNPSHTGNAIILAGTDSDATAAAAEFLTSEDDLNRFRKRLNVDTLPYFEVLLRTTRLSGTSLSAEFVAYRTHADLR